MAGQYVAGAACAGQGDGQREAVWLTGQQVLTAPVLCQWPSQWPHGGCWPVGGETGLSQAAAVGTQHSSSSWLTMPGEPTSCLGNGSAPGLAPGNAVAFQQLPAWLRHVPCPMGMTPLGLLLCHSSGVPWCARARGSSPRQSAPACCLAGSRRLVPGIAWPCDHGGGWVLACRLHGNFGVSPLLWGQGRE